MLSNRGSRSAASQDIPWRFAPGGDNRYDKETNPTGVISFGTAENNLMQEELEKFVAEKVTVPASAFTYRSSTIGGPSFPKAMATHINEYFDPFTPINPSHILTSAALTAMHEMLAFSLADEGEGILVSRPIYGRFELDFGNTASLEIIYADMNGVDPFSEDVVGNYERAFESAVARGVVVKALLIVNPHNPLGRCYPPETLKAIMRFCGKKSIHLISDEVYALSVYDTQSESAPGFTSVLSFDPTDLISTDLLHVLYGMSKDFAAAGLRLGCLITQNSNLRKAITANVRFHNPSGPAIEIGTAILNDQPFVVSFIAKSRQRLSEARKFTTQVLDSVGIRYAGGGNAGFFIYIDLSPWLPEDIEEVTGNEREYALAQRLLDGGVGLHPCEEHYDVKGHFRLVFSHERDVLEVGLTRLLRVLGFDVAGLEEA